MLLPNWLLHFNLKLSSGKLYPFRDICVAVGAFMFLFEPRDKEDKAAWASFIV
jgi:hypothetical protein